MSAMVLYDTKIKINFKNYCSGLFRSYSSVFRLIFCVSSQVLRSEQKGYNLKKYQTLLNLKSLSNDVRRRYSSCCKDAPIRNSKL